MFDKELLKEANCCAYTGVETVTPGAYINNAERVIVLNLDLAWRQGEPVRMGTFVGFKVEKTLELQNIILNDSGIPWADKIECGKLVLNNLGKTETASLPEIEDISIYVTEEVEIGRSFMPKLWIKMEAHAWVNQYLSEKRDLMHGTYAYTPDVRSLIPEYTVDEIGGLSAENNAQVLPAAMMGCLFLCSTCKPTVGLADSYIPPSEVGVETNSFSNFLSQNLLF